MSKNKTWAIGVSLIVVVAVGYGLYLAGSPLTARKVNADNTRIQALSQIYYAVDNFYRTKKTLPASLSELQQQPAYYVNGINDPVSKQPFEYKVVTADSAYELCATFDLASDSKQMDNQYYPYDPTNTFWQHSAGRYCYSLEVNKPATVDYPPVLPPVKY